MGKSGGLWWEKGKVYGEKRERVILGKGGGLWWVKGGGLLLEKGGGLCVGGRERVKDGKK